LSFFKLFFLNPLFLRGFFFKAFLFELSFFKPFFFGGFDVKSFLAFLVLFSGKLDANLSDSFFKKRFFILGGLSWRLKGGEWFQMLPIPLKK
ncbi:hypothetical protein ECC07_04655, partial [Helicobacter pylori]